ncbi:7TM diverse intracellular signaling domain-containing protein [Caenimonas sp. SL110]|uniref:sensor domain-containing diguanylate cyclase n=1 Tax=Caenimonas sp. SL110 TaxID=1450524 RepID=UPI0006540A8F|nr:7TM diverse intracellular signaling domain-containing protein [Caenimonas sp. SL110]
MRTFLGLWGALLILAGWLGLAHAQAQAQAQPVPVPALAPISLTPQNRVSTIDLRSRFWVDPTARRTVEEVATGATAWAVREPGRSYNIDGRALWIEFVVQAPAGGRWFVELQSSGIDRVQLFRPTADGRWVQEEAGDSRAVSRWPLPGRFPTFELATSASVPMRHFLRIEHARVDFATPIAIYDHASLLASRESEQFLLGGYFGLALLIGVVSAANAIAFRDRNFGVYAVYVLALAVGQLAYLGVGAQHIWNEQLDWNQVATFVLPGISAAAGLWFARTVTEPARFSARLDLFVWVLIAVLLACVALDTALSTRTTFAVLMLLTVVALVVIFGLVAMVWAKGDDPNIRLIALGFVPVVVMALFPLARGLNLVAASGWTRYGLSIGAALEMPILFYALSLRGSRRRESQVRAAALSHSDALTGLAHERTLLQRLDAALVRARSMRHSCALLGVRISNYDVIVADLGAGVAERALVVAASLMRGAITDIDLASRVGEHEFVLLLEGPTTTENAMSRAQQLVASGLRPSPALPPGTTLKFHIAVAVLPEASLDAISTVKWLLDGLKTMRADTRKLIRPLNF